MDLDFFLSFGIALVSFALGYLGVHMTVHELPSEPTLLARTRRNYKWGFILLSAAALALIAWQGLENSRSQRKASSELAAMSRTVAAMRAESAPKPSREELLVQASRVAIARRSNSIEDSTSSRLLLLSAEIIQFSAERAAGQPDVDIDTFYRLFDDARYNPDYLSKVSDEERLEQSHLRNQGTGESPPLSEQDRLWLRNNRASVAYYENTKQLFKRRFGPELKKMAKEIKSEADLKSLLSQLAVVPSWRSRD